MIKVDARIQHGDDNTFTLCTIRRIGPNAGGAYKCRAGIGVRHLEPFPGHAFYIGQAGDDLRLLGRHLHRDTVECVLIVELDIHAVSQCDLALGYELALAFLQVLLISSTLRTIDIQPFLSGHAWIGCCQPRNTAFVSGHCRIGELDDVHRIGT